MRIALGCILGDPGAASRDDGIFMGESLQQERESPWALTLTERVPEAFEITPFSGQSAKRNRRATLTSSYTRLLSSSSGRAPGHLLSPNEFQKRLKSRLLIGQKNIFLANQRRGTAGPRNYVARAWEPQLTKA